MDIIKDSITDQIYKVIKNKIILQNLKLGAQIDPKEVATEYNISVTPVRDALKKLESQGLVTRKTRWPFLSVPFLQIRLRKLWKFEKYMRYIV